MKQSLCLLILIAISVRAEQLTINRIYSDPGLGGPSLKGLKISPDGERVTYLKPKQTDFLKLDLWEYNLKANEHSMLVDSDELVNQEQLSDEEQARRERQRIRSKGIISYFWARNSKGLLFPLGGDLYFYELIKNQAKQLVDTREFETDPQISPNGKSVAFIRNQNLYVVDIASGKETQLTFDGKGTIKNGMAEFIAQEEMDRDTGYWWSPDSRAIAFLQIDESPVGIEERYEIDDESFKVFKQRYPRTGTANVTYKLGVIKLTSKKIRWLDIKAGTDIYIPRVNWFKDNQHLLVQQQNREQTILNLIKLNVNSGKSRRIHREKSNAWINLHHNLKFLKDGKHFVWGSEASGFMQLYLFDVNGKKIRQLSNGEGVVKSLQGIDEAQGWVYFTANYNNPLETHLYKASLHGKKPQLEKISQRSGNHNISLAKSASTYVDLFSSIKQPPQASLHNITGKHMAWLEENKLAEGHPYWPYINNHITPEFGTISAADGQAMYYRLYKPAKLEKGKRYPAIIDVYGGPGVQRVVNAWGGRNGYWHQYMVDRGYIVFSLDNRGSDNRGVKFESPIHKLLGEIEVEDQVKGVEFLRSLPYVDKHKIGIFGWSYGGYMAIMSMFKKPDIFAAGVAVAPVTDWRLYDTHYTERYLGHPMKNAKGYDASNVFPYIDGYRDNLLIIHGMADDNVLFLNSTRLYAQLQNKIKPFEQSNYPGKKHGIRGKSTSIHLFKQITDFFDRKLAQPSNH